MTAVRVLRRRLALLCVSLVLATQSFGAQPSLYDRLGQRDGVAKIAKDLIERSSTFHQTSRSFKDTDIERIVEQLTDQLCNLTGGPCTYEGDTMKDVHAGHGITQSEMYGMVEILEDVLKTSDIGIREKNELLYILAPMKRDVVEK